MPWHQNVTYTAYDTLPPLPPAFSGRLHLHTLLHFWSLMSYWSMFAAVFLALPRK